MILVVVMPFLFFIVARVASLAAHELAHVGCAWLLGFRSGIALQFSSGLHASVRIKGIDQRSACIVRHAGWLASVAAAMIVTWLCTEGRAPWALAACWTTAAEALLSDLLGLVGSSDTFCCGNFAVLMLRATHHRDVLSILRTMVRTTMARGAQSAGIVSFKRHRTHKGAHVARRTRVVNGKRTDLCELLLGKETQRPRITVEHQAPQLLAGHTRFATSSHATMDGCHPHRWSAERWHTVWSYCTARCAFASTYACCEGFVTHNGDLDYYAINGTEYTLLELQALLPHILHQPLPSATDSACLAGLFDLLRARGVWLLAVRYGLIFGGLRPTHTAIPDAARKMHNPGALPDAATLERLAEVFEDGCALRACLTALLRLPAVPFIRTCHASF